MTREHRGIAAALLSSCLGGTAVVATRHLVAHLDLLTLALMRYGIGVLCLGGLLALRRYERPRGRDLVTILLLGGLFFAVFPLLFNLGLSWTTAARGALALSTLPLLTLALAALLAAETLTRRKAAGVILALVGVGVALSGDLGAAPADAWRGDLVMVAAAAGGAFYNVLSRPVLQRHPPLAFLSQAMLAGILILSVATAVVGEPAGLLELTPVGWLSLIYLGVAGGAAAFFLWTYALEHTTPTRVAVTVTLNPVIAMVLGSLLLDEPATPFLLLGLAAVALGIVLTTREAAPAAPKALSPAAGSPPRAGR